MPQDIEKIKRNVAKMVGMGAPETDIDAYIQSEGVTIDEIKNAPMVTVNYPDGTQQNRFNGMLNDSISGDPAETGTFRTAIDQFNQGTLQGWADELTDPLGAAVSVAMTDPIGFLKGEVNDPALAEQIINARASTQKNLKAQREESPWISAGSNLAGALTGLAAASKFIPSGVSTRAGTFARANPATAAMLTGGSSAGLYSAGASENEGLERLDNLAWDVPIGMAGGYAGYRLAKAGSGLANSLDERFQLGDKARSLGRMVGVIDDQIPAAGTVSDDAAAAIANTADDAALDPIALGGILDERELAKLEKGQVLPLTAGDKTQDVVQQRAEQVAATFGGPTAPINLARQEQKAAMQRPFMSVLGDDQILDDVSLDLRKQAEVESAAKMLREQYDALGRRVSKAYNKAEEMGAYIPVETIDDLKFSLKSVYDENIGIKGKFSNFESVIDELDEVKDMLSKEGVTAKSISALEKWKKNSLNAVNPEGAKITENSAKRILGIANAKYEEFMDGLIEKSIVSGDGGAIQAFRDARGLAKEKFAFYESDKGIQKILDNRDLSGSNLVNIIMGANKIGGKGDDGRIVETMLRLAGDKSPEMQAAMKRGVAAKIMNDALGRTPDSRSVFDMAGAMQKSLNGIMKNKETFGAIFDETEQKYFKQLSDDLGKIAGKQIGAINRSGSGTYVSQTMSGLAKVLSNPFFSKMTAGISGALGGGLKSGLEKKAMNELIGQAEAGLDDFIAKAISEIDAPAIYYGAYGGQTAIDPFFYAVGKEMFGADNEVKNGN